MSTDDTDYYSILNVPREATENQIKKAYHKLSLKWHPDKNDSEEAKSKFQEISEAAAVLSDSKKREIYDKFGKQGLESDGMGGMDASDFFQSFFGGGMPGMGGLPGMRNKKNKYN